MGNLSRKGAKMTKRLDKKLTLITGAAQGLGKALSKRFAQEGSDLILLDREAKDLENLDDSLKEYDVSVTLVPLDLRKFGAFEELATTLRQRFGCLDTLIGNAAILGELGPLTHQTFDQWQEILDVNLTANWQLLKSFEPLLKASKAGRALFVSAGLAMVDKAYWGPYSVSKAALEKLVRVYAQEVQKTSLRINMVDPGDLRTAMHAKAMPGLNPQNIPCPESVTDIFVDLASPDCTVSGQLFYAQNEVATHNKVASYREDVTEYKEDVTETDLQKSA
jgi:NAD(P)-dependent dehydrogenase (short-subunit alcohol dehydrogenase family)